jgi:hypothetical protein
MKTAIVSSILILLLASNCMAQCNTEAISLACNNKLAGFTFLKDYKLDAKKAKNGVIEYSYVFSKDTQYMLSICDGNAHAPKVEVILMDGNRNVLSSNKENGKYYSGIAYKCNTTGIYYMTFNISNSTEKCMVSALGFRK